MLVHQIFSTPILQFKFSKHSQYSLPNFPKGERNPAKWDCSLYTTYPNVLSDDKLVSPNFIKSLKKDLKSEINILFKDLEIHIDWHFEHFWYNYYYEGQGQETHDHLANVGEKSIYWSGIYYHTTNETSTGFVNPCNSHMSHRYPNCTEGKLATSHFDSWYPFVKDGDVLLFPPYLRHYVPPSPKSEKMRFTFSFNLLL